MNEMAARKPSRGRSNEYAIRTAAALRHSGSTIRDTAKECKVSVGTIVKWKETEVWQDEWRKLDEVARNRRRKLVESQWDVIDAASKKLAQFSVVNIQSAINSQKAIAEALKDVRIPAQIRSLDELATATKALHDLTRMVAASWDNFQVAVELEEFIQQNQSAPSLQFEEYTEEEIAEIRRTHEEEE